MASEDRPLVEERDFAGFADRECGEHRTTGTRAWCFTCSTWCYPESPCPGCEVPMLREKVDRLLRRQKEADSLIEMAWGLLSNVSGGDWTKQSKGWGEVAVEWRENFHRWLDAAVNAHVGAHSESATDGR